MTVPGSSLSGRPDTSTGSSGSRAGDRVRAIRAPAGLAFYVPSVPLESGPAGQVIWARRLTGAAALAEAAENLLVLHHSRSVAGQDTAVSGTVAIPPGLPPPGGWPALSWAHGITGVADSCAPSRDGPSHPSHISLQLADAMLNHWVKRGWAVVRTDYEGLGTPGRHPYLIGASEARGTVDILLAARQLFGGIGRRWAVMGHSQGGHAALFTASLGPALAPDLDLIGAVALCPAASAGYVLEEDPETRRSGTSGGFLALALIGAAAADCAVHPEQLLTPAALRLLSMAETRGIDDLVSAGSSMAPAEMFRRGADTRPLLKVLAASDPANLRLSAPALILQGIDDPIVARHRTRKIARSLRARGASVDYREYPGTGHFDLIAAALAESTRWLDARLTEGAAAAADPAVTGLTDHVR
jgi:acetyl esterase/lipase